MADAQASYNQISIKTANNLRTIARAQSLADLSRLSLPEIDAVVDQVAQVVPAGNVPGIILNGLARLPGRKPPPQTVKRDVNLLFKGVNQTLDKAVYGALFAGPAAVIWGYQNLLKLAGKDPEDSFPEGTWQFYVDYALREDTARHVNETHGFDTDLKRHNLQLSEVDRVTAWVMAAINCLHQYPNLLANEWRERVYTALLQAVTTPSPAANSPYAHLYRTWEKQRPYSRGADVDPQETYPQYRRRKFDAFLAEATTDLPEAQRREWRAKIEAAEKEELPAYRQQMSILAYLDPGQNDETRTPISLKEAHVGVIHQGRYYLLPACRPQTDQPAEVNTVREHVATLMRYPANSRPVALESLARLKRHNWPDLRKKLNANLIKDLDTLRLAPILLNCDHRSRRLPLAQLRQAERGIGDHPLTLFDTGETVAMDQSHIFFDGAWGAALAEILANEALSWAVYLSALPAPQPRQIRAHALTFRLEAVDRTLIGQTPQVTPEATAESEAVNIKAILRLRRLFKRRNDLIQLTVNDLLVLYRAIHAFSYEPNPTLMAQLQQLAHHRATHKAATAALESIAESRQVNPAMVIPVDGSQRVPRERLYPVTFEVPLHDLNLIELHQSCIAALDGYKSGGGDRTANYASFDQTQRAYLATLAGFGAVLSKTKEIAFAGESASVGAIKMLAHIPGPLKQMLDAVPSRIDLLNDILKGREVFSNVGAVAPTSTLTRFLTAKDDNDKKSLAWGILTDAGGVMRITLRDFRPHVGLLIAVDQAELATWIVQDYLESYVQGLNRYITDLQRITETSRETRLARPE